MSSAQNQFQPMQPSGGGDPSMHMRPDLIQNQQGKNKFNFTNFPKKLKANKRQYFELWAATMLFQTHR